MTISLNGRIIRNAIEEAVYGVLGGVTKTANGLGISGTAIYQMLECGHARTRDMAKRMEELTITAGVRIPAAELLALEAWKGPDRHPDGQRRDPRKLASSHRRTPPPSGFYPTPAPADAQLAA